MTNTFLQRASSNGYCKRPLHIFSLFHQAFFYIDISGLHSMTSRWLYPGKLYVILSFFACPSWGYLATSQLMVYFYNEPFAWKSTTMFFASQRLEQNATSRHCNGRFSILACAWPKFLTLMSLQTSTA